MIEQHLTADEIAQRAIDLAWAAGLFEGEGSFVLIGPAQIRASMSTSDLDVLERFRSIVGMGSVFEKRPYRTWRPHWRTQWSWYVDGEAVVQLFGLIGPFLGERRRAQATTVIQTREQRKREVTVPRDCARCGARFAPAFHPSSARQRYCSQRCRYDAHNERKRAARTRGTALHS